MKTFNISVEQIPSIILKLLGLGRPFYLPSIEKLDLPADSVDQVLVVIIDNFSLFEIVTYQPVWMIKNLENLLLIETESKAKALSGPMLQSMFYSTESLTFNLVSTVVTNGKRVRVIAREEDIPKITTLPNVAMTEKTDVNIYVKALKALNRHDLLILHFADFDEMYERYSMNPPAEIASKIMRRTDKWLNLFCQQSIQGTALLVIGNDGKKVMDMGLEGKVVEWKRANLPIGFLKYL
ncbi:hypothetical protein DRO91_01060 [Candidatus Heimdallarchaeota archaeon]|nr:MAG: hypothetical protein DRO63_01210 [Candidatus Gerdarchaeota archaeon]RLI72933.1 MAG: hypothetical protein DRP02_00045 [Candidatus Gerdarchaeota archaeon]RLI74221.1 MAG: hypothetical protein DRO91_01060 [Candidatus Heimdallarchaeota archaeon]